MPPRAGWNCTCEWTSRILPGWSGCVTASRTPPDFGSEDARAAEGEFYTLLGNLYDQERTEQPKLDYAAFRRGIIVRCKQRISKGG